MNEVTIYQHNTTPFLAEVVYACLAEQGMLPDNISVNMKGAFKKTFSNDVESLSIDDETPKKTAIIEINRDGFYDILPEGLFHQTRGMQAVRTVQDAVKEHRIYKEEERLARKFFAPLEEMIFRYRALAELSERKALYKEDNEQLTNSLFDFWNIEKTLPRTEALRMVKLMPYLNTVKGNKTATAEALSFILNTEVTITDVEKRTVADLENEIMLENMMLGVNAVTGNNCNEIIYAKQITIHHINAERVEEYTGNNPGALLLKRFSEIFIPVDWDIFFELDILKSETMSADYILGYGCTL